MLHFSDPHVGLGLWRVPLRDWPGKRLAGAVNLLRGRGRRFRDALPALAGLARLASREGADAAVCTGDLSALGTDAELEAARAAVDPFFQLPLGFVCLPGNHDLYTASVLREQRFERWFGEGLATDLPALRSDGAWPLVRFLGDAAAVVAVNSARPNPLPWRSSGRVPDGQLEGLRAALARADVRDRFVLVATHYAPLRADGKPDAPLHGMDNAPAFLDACAGVRRGMILCGHIHHPFRWRAAGLAAEVLCAGSATLEVRRAAWWIEVGPDGAEIRPVRPATPARDEWEIGPAGAPSPS
ncbi:MAG: metallophosphoesterase [Gemmatimonadota bacterium]|nr:metallophosphoesterase [Gemmatimonadota bacterium]